MHGFSLMHLSPEVAMKSLDAIYSEEKSRVAEVIALIAVIDARGDYLDAGYSCMRSYCRDRLKMTVDEAARRVQVARAALQFPELFECLADGRLGVTTASMLAPHLAPETAGRLLAEASHRSKLEILQLLAARSRGVAGTAGGQDGAVDVRNTSGRRAPEHAVSSFNLSALTAIGSSSTECAPAHVPEHVESSRRGRVSPAPAGGYDVRLTISEDDHQVLCRTQALLGHAVPSGDPAEIYARAMKHYLAHLEKQRLGVKPGAAPALEPSGRGVPRPLRRLVWERDGGRCSFVSPDGHRCDETFRLEIDHVQPLALGGRTTPDNLRVLCRAHNQHEAGRVLGKEHVARRRDLAQRARARARVAAQASAARARQRDAAGQARHDDLHAALRGLGFGDAESCRGAAMVDAMPDAPLEACLRRALAELTRAVAWRAERMARCST